MFPQVLFKAYTSESSDDESVFDSFFGSITVPTIDADAAATLDNPFSKEEFVAATRSMQNGKSPGPDVRK